MKKKKLIISLLALACLATSAFALSSCESKEDFLNWLKANYNGNNKECGEEESSSNQVNQNARGVGEQSFDFTLKTYQIEDGAFTTDGEEFILSEHRGKVVILNFWATWCGPCKEEIPHFNEFYEENFESVEMVIINAEPAMSMPEIANFMNTPFEESGDYVGWTGFSCTFAKYEEENNVKDLFLVKAFDKKANEWIERKAQSLPLTIIVDKEGIIRYADEGKLEKTELEELVLPLVG